MMDHLIKILIRFWLATTSILVFLFGWILIAQSEEPDPIVALSDQESQALIPTQLPIPTLAPIKTLPPFPSLGSIPTLSSIPLVGSVPTLGSITSLAPIPTFEPLPTLVQLQPTPQVIKDATEKPVNTKSDAPRLKAKGS